MKENPDCLYSCERGLKEEVLLTTETQKIQVLFDQTLSGLNANQTVSSERPTLSTAKNAKRFYFEFNGTDDKMISNIDLNPANFPDVVNIFILFRL